MVQRVSLELEALRSAALNKVTMPVGIGIEQERTYDQRGFLSSESHPEKGSSGGGCTSYSQYNPLGQAETVVDGPFTHNYSYARVGGRVIAIHDGDDRLLKAFIYGTESTADNRANGQLTQAITYQYPTLSGARRYNQRSHLIDDNGRRQVVRNGYIPERDIQTPMGPIDIKQRRVRDRRSPEQRELFSSKILPPYLRKTESIEELIPFPISKAVPPATSWRLCRRF